MVWPTGAEYVGQYCNNQKKGFGKLTLPDGSTYQGYFDKGCLHGEILHIATDGKAFRMEFDFDQLVSDSLEQVPAASIPSYEKTVGTGCNLTLEAGYEMFIKSEGPTDVEDEAQCSEQTCSICMSELCVGDTCCE